MDGLLIVDKPCGITSHDVVHRLRKITAERSIGHLGTLDPLATGVLPLLLGRYTRLARFFGAREKEYSGRICFGVATDTYDSMGAVTLETPNTSIDPERLQALVAGFRGRIDQVPPAFSAKKIGGVPAHRLARKGQAPAMRPVSIDVHEFSVRLLDPKTAEFHVTVSAGGYVRSLVHDLGKSLGCGAHLTELRRLRAGEFTAEMAVPLEQLENNSPKNTVALPLLASRAVLAELPAVTVSPDIAARFRQGLPTNLPEFSSAPYVRVFGASDTFIAIARRLASTLFAPDCVIG
jgi:tRNA pseudouridine55 synthase